MDESETSRTTAQESAKAQPGPAPRPGAAEARATSELAPLEAEDVRGLTEQKGSRWGLRGKTFWDWLQLFVVPLALVMIGYFFTAQQDARQQRAEEQRADIDRWLAEQRAQEEALQAYLDQMSGLLLERDLRASEEGSEVRMLARARTLAVLERVEPGREREVVEFLIETGLVQSEGTSEPIISLHAADLRHAELSGIELSGADLSGADLTGAHLRYADLSATDLSNANLTCGEPTYRDPDCADLVGANLKSADLSGAYLMGANLEDAEGLTEAQLEQTALLEGATMPNGQKYEVWLKSKDSEEDGEGSGSS